MSKPQRGGKSPRREPRREPRGPGTSDAAELRRIVKRVRERTGATTAAKNRPAIELQSTTLWEYPSQHYTASDGSTEQGDKAYAGATPSWVIWQLLQRYTKPGDTVLDPMCGSGTTIDVCRDLGREAVAFDLAPSRGDIRQSDARELPAPDACAEFVFVDPPYSTHIDYSDDPRCIGKLSTGGADRGRAYYDAMAMVLSELTRVLKPGGTLGLYVSDSFRKKRGRPEGVFMPIGFELFSIMRRTLTPVDIIAVARHNEKLRRGAWKKAAGEQNFFLRGFNYLFIMRRERTPRHNRRAPKRGP